MVLAAGAGRRLRPDTDTLPKALLPVAGTTTILDIALRNLAAAGLDEVVIVVGHAGRAIAGRAAALERAHQVRLTLVPNDRAMEWNNAYSLWLARALRRGRPAGQRRHGAPGQRGEDTARRAWCGRGGPRPGQRQATGRGGDEGGARRARAAGQDHQADGPGA